MLAGFLIAAGPYMVVIGGFTQKKSLLGESATSAVALTAWSLLRAFETNLD